LNHVQYSAPIGPDPLDPFEKYRVEPIGERQTKGEVPKPPDDEEPPRTRLKFTAYVVHLFQKTVDFFLEAHQHAKGVGNPLAALQAALEILKTENRSEDVRFLNELSLIWSALMEDSLSFKQKEVEEKFRLLVKKILHYPQNLPHSFGYYLTEYAGQKWVPFPYMELIQNLHREHEKNPAESALTEWTRLINDISSLLQ